MASIITNLQTNSLNKWPIFSLLATDFINNIHFVCVFGAAGNEALIVTRDDDVYSLGSNSSSCLGLGDMQSGLDPRKVDVLCQKKVINFAYGSSPHVLAITDTGDLFSWGHNGYSQLGHSCATQPVLPTRVSSLMGLGVVEIACGSHHSLALTSEGEVYAWGYNNCGQIGSGNTTNQQTPRKVQANLLNKLSKHITCGQTSSMALTDEGELFAWGYNGNGQLGVGSNTNQPTPCKVFSLNGLIVTQVVCGYAHALVLTDNGLVYAWGANSYGQLGNGSKSNLVTPSRIGKEIGRATEIAASHCSHISAATSQNGKVYMWGQCRGQCIMLPTETKFSLIDDVFACFATPPSMWRILTVRADCETGVRESIASAFNDKNSSDITFVIEDKPIYVHKSILKIRCEYFKTMFSEHWDAAEKKTIEIDEFNFVVFHAFLHYLYTDSVDMCPEDAIGLLDLANCYCEMELKQICEDTIKKGITRENVSMILSVALKFKAESLEEFCLRFALNHMTEIVTTKAFAELEREVIIYFMTKAANKGAFKT